MNKVLLPRFYPLNLVKLISFLLIKKKKKHDSSLKNKNKATHSLSYQFGAYPSRFFPYKNAFILFLILLTQPFHLVYCIFYPSNCLKHHVSLSKNGILMCEHTYIPLILEVNEDIVQCIQQKVGRDHFRVTPSLLP